jgi:hypothetical protein
MNWLSSIIFPWHLNYRNFFRKKPKRRLLLRKRDVCVCGKLITVSLQGKFLRHKCERKVAP